MRNIAPLALVASSKRLLQDKDDKGADYSAPFFTRSLNAGYRRDVITHSWNEHLAEHLYLRWIQLQEALTQG